MKGSDVSMDSLIVSESQKECAVPVLSIIKTASSCVAQNVCVITTQGSSNPNCLNFLKDAFKIYQCVPPTYY